MFSSSASLIRIWTIAERRLHACLQNPADRLLLRDAVKRTLRP